MIEKEIAIDSYGNRLSGTVCLPEGDWRFPLVLMLHGSGPLDRDENMKGQQLNVFNTIAHYLAREGIASLRYDKRGCGKSSGDYFATGHANLVHDAICWFDVLRQGDFCAPERMYLLGHSEGCIIAPQVSAVRPSVAGLMLLCPFVDDIESILIKQASQLENEFKSLPGLGGVVRRVLSRMMGVTVKNQKKLVRILKSTNKETFRSGLHKVPAKSLRELMRLDARAIFSQVTCPMLLIGGEKDLQCDPSDVGRIAELAKGSVDKHVIKNLTHVLRFDERQASLLGSAELIKKPMEPVVLELIAAWINEHRYC